MELLDHMVVLFFNILRSFYTSFHCGYTILHYHQQRVSVSISAHLQHFLSFVCFVLFCFLFGNSHPIRCVEFHCGFNFRFPHYKWYRAFFHIPVGHFYIFFGKITYHVLSLFLNWVISFCLFVCPLLFNCRSFLNVL